MSNWKEYFHEKRKTYIYWKNTLYVRFLLFFNSKIFTKQDIDNDDEEDNELLFNY